MPPAEAPPRTPLLSYPPGGSALALLCAIYLLPGLIGHDPWKADDATHFGIVYAMLQSGQWTLPQLAGEPLHAAAPLFYWLAALTGKLFGLLLPLHDAVRLATGVCAALLLLGLSRAARRLYGETAGRCAPLAMIGCLGLLIHVHDTQPAIALLAAGAFALLGIARMRERPLSGGLIAGAAAGLGFLASGWTAAALLAPLPLLVSLLCSGWRKPAVLGGALVALVVCLALGALWPALLGAADRAVWEAQARAELAGYQPSMERAGAYLAMLPWFAWPALPLALWTLWRQRATPGSPGVALPLVAFVWALLVLSASADARSLSALPLLLPLALLAAPAAESLRRGASNAFDWFAMMTFSLAAGLVWLGWVAMTTGWPPRIARNFAKIEPGFVMQFSVATLAIGLVLTVGWFWLLRQSPRAPVRGTVHWAAGMTVMWALALTLWLPWIDYGKSYRGLAQSLKSALPAQRGCIAGQGLGQAQRASLHYFARVLTIPQRRPGADNCRLLLVQATGRAAAAAPLPGWRLLWEGRRPGDRSESFRLYSRD